jgi:hypothetical protein
MLLTLVLLAGSVLEANPPLRDGIIEGTVVRAKDHTPVSGAEVVLRRKVGNQLVPIAEITADAQGRFRFENLPADAADVYVPGANRDNIHYPGPGVKLTSLRRRAEVTLAVHDAVAFPNPLVVRRHSITLCPQPGVLRVTESLLIDNPSLACYVGQAPSEHREPVTLRLAIPANFAQVTFASEFFGRRFSLIDGKLVTGVPWPPGQRELTFSYLLTDVQQRYVWKRPLDLPSTKVRVSIRGDQAGQFTSNLNRSSQEQNGEVAFESGEHALSGGYLLRVELGHLPMSAMAYAPWWALTMLAGLIFLTSVIHSGTNYRYFFQRQRSTARTTNNAVPAIRQSPPHQRRGRRAQR